MVLTKKTVNPAEKYPVKGLNVARLALNLMKLPGRNAVNVMEKKMDIP